MHETTIDLLGNGFVPNYENPKFVISLIVCENCQIFSVNSINEEQKAVPYQEVIGALQVQLQTLIYDQLSKNRFAYAKQPEYVNKVHEELRKLSVDKAKKFLDGAKNNVDVMGDQEKNEEERK